MEFIHLLNPYLYKVVQWESKGPMCTQGNKAKLLQKAKDKHAKLQIKYKDTKGKE